MYSIDFLLLVGIVALGLGAAGGMLLKSTWTWLRRSEDHRLQMSEQIKELEAAVESLKEELKTSGPKRHTHSVEAALGDALGIAIDILQEYENSQKYIEARTVQLSSILKQARQGPHAYPTERPAGRRPSRRHESYDA